MTWVDLTQRAARHAALIGSDRDWVAKQQHRTPAKAGGTWVANIVGAMGEVAVAIALGADPCQLNVGGNDRASGDVGEWEVRTSAGRAEMPITDRIDDSRLCVFVRGEPPRPEIAGWIRAAEARQHPEWRTARYGFPPAFYVPISALHHWDERPF